MTTTTDAPRRFKTEDELTPDERRAVKRAISAGQAPPQFPTDEQREYLDAQRAELAQRRAAAQRDVDEAQRALGIAVMEQTSGTPAGKRLESARAELEAIAAAERELTRRDEEDKQRHVEAIASAARARAYRWWGAYLTAAEEVLRARATLAEAERALSAVGTNAKIERLHMNGLTDADLDLELLRTVPRGSGRTRRLQLGGGAHLDEFRDTGRLTIVRCRELREKAQRLAAAEAVA